MQICGTNINKENTDSRLQDINHGHRFALVDCEVGLHDRRIHDIGAWRDDSAIFHKPSKSELVGFISGVDYICGHNIVHHDAKYLFDEAMRNRWILVDTLYMSPLLFPERPYHRLVKDDKLDSDQANNPVNDCIKALNLLMDEVSAWRALAPQKRIIYTTLLSRQPEFSGFLDFVGECVACPDVTTVILDYFKGRVCENAPLDDFVKDNSIELAYALAQIDTKDRRSVTPPWVLANYPKVEYLIKRMRQCRCSVPCDYCNKQLNVRLNLQNFFGFADFRHIERRLNDPIIPDELWHSAKQATSLAYAHSANLCYVMRCAELFESINHVKYIGDFREYVFESSLEDFSTNDGNEVVVSTIHKAKGREFDDEYMLVANRNDLSSDDGLFRALYVGMTRAKKRLYIHTDCPYFNNLSADSYKTDANSYFMPDEVALQLSHKDVFLNFFRGIKRDVIVLQAGDQLMLRDNVFYSSANKPVAKLSQKMQSTLAQWSERGYHFGEATVRFIVAWKGKESPKYDPESAVLLPDLILRRKLV